MPTMPLTLQTDSGPTLMRLGQEWRLRQHPDHVTALLYRVGLTVRISGRTVDDILSEIAAQDPPATVRVLRSPTGATIKTTASRSWGKPVGGVR